MTIDIGSLQTFTDAEILKAVRAAKVKLLLGAQSYSIHGRTFTRASLPELDAIEQNLQQKIDAAAGNDIALARFNRPV